MCAALYPLAFESASVMNTPRTKQRTRWSPTDKYHRHPECGGSWGIIDREVAAEFGFLVSYWWHVEEVMTWVLEDLLEGKRNETFSSNSPVRKIFRTVVSEDARIKIMWALLEGAPHNSAMPELYDDIIDEFRALNGIRNRLVHGFWYTDATGKVTLRASSNDPIELETPQEITAKYLRKIGFRMQKLYGDAALRGGGPVSSRGTPLPPRDARDD